MRKAIIAILGSTSALALALPAHAQEAGARPATEEPDEGGEIIVTARRRDEDAQDVPLVINTVTSETVAKLNLQNFTEVQNLVPGLQLRNQANGIGGNAQIRGVAFDINASTQATVEFYYNDAPISAGAVLQQMYDVGQIDVLRGPQGTLRGRASPSGSITVTTRKPDLQDFGGNVSMSGNNLGTINFNGALGLPIIKDVLAIRVAGLWNEDEVNRVRTIDKDLDSRDPFSRAQSGRISALFQPADWLRFEGMYQKTDTRTRAYDQYASFSLFSPSALPSPVLIRPEDRLSIQESPRNVHQQFEVFNWRAEGRFAGQVLIYQGSRENMEVLAKTNSDSANFFDKADVFQTTNTQSHSTTHEIRLQNEDRVGGIFDYVVGYFHQNRTSPTNLTQETGIYLPLPASFGGGLVFVQPTAIATGSSPTENSVFANVIAHIGDKLQVSGGLRHISFKAPPTTLTIGTNNLAGALAVDDKAWIYNASVQYFINPEVMIYASTGTSRRPGPTIVGNFSLVQSDRTRSFQFLDSEDSTSYEAGIKSTFMDNRLRLNVTGFHQTFKNYPYKLTTGVFYQSFGFVSGTGIVPSVALSGQFAANVPVEVNGIEAEIGFRPTPNFDINVVASYSDGKIKNGLIPCDDLNQDGKPDNLTSAPTLAQVQTAYGTNYIGQCSVTQRSSGQSPFSATVQASYNLPVSDKVNFFTRGLFTFLGDAQGDPANAFDSVSSHGLLNLFAGLRDPGGAWEVNFFAKNVFNTVKVLTNDGAAVTGYQALQPPTFRTTAGASATSPYAIIRTTAPREFGLNVRFAFGSR